jgi:hypothetical protein
MVPPVVVSTPVIRLNGRALAGAVGTDQRDDLAGLDVERDVVDGDHAAELFSRFLDLQQHGGRGRRALALGEGKRRVRAPCGPA